MNFKNWEEKGEKVALFQTVGFVPFELSSQALPTDRDFHPEDT
jgi:hypothetical protein